MVGIRERLHITVIRDCDRLMSPFHRAFYDILDIRHAVHITHLGMAVKFHSFLRTVIHTNRRKIRTLLDSDD